MTQHYRRAVLAALIWAALCLGLPALAATLNGLKPWGTPLGLALFAQGAPALLVVAAAVLGRREGSLERSAEDQHKP